MIISRKQRRLLAPILYPVSLIYGLIAAIRNKFFDWRWIKSVEFGFPVISVGNITVGGTGKTPHVEYILQLLSDKYPVAFLSRGYKRKTKGFRLAGKQDGPSELGDEPFQVFSKFGRRVKVAVGEDRVNGIRQLKQQYKELKAVVLDDAFQHRKVKPGVSIVLIDYYRPVFKDYYLPMGDLRESVHGLRRANIVIVTKVPGAIKPIEKRLWIKELDLFPYQFLFFTSFEYGKLRPLFRKNKDAPEIKKLKGENYSCLLVTGIANPKPIQDYVEKYIRKTEVLAYADHQEYGPEHVKEVTRKFSLLEEGKRIIITTEKDAVKLSQLKFSDQEIMKSFYYLPVTVKFQDRSDKQFNEQLDRYVSENKGISRLHK